MSSIPQNKIIKIADVRATKVEQVQNIDADFGTVDVMADLHSFKNVDKKLIGVSRKINNWPFLKQMVDQDFYGVLCTSDEIKRALQWCPQLKRVLVVAETKDGYKVKMDDQRWKNYPGEEYKTNNADFFFVEDKTNVNFEVLEDLEWYFEGCEVIV